MTMRHRRTCVRRAAAGFSLLELTCALFVVTVGGFGAIQLYMTAVQKTQATQNYALATRALVNEIEARRALPFDAIAPGEDQPFVSAGPALEALDGAVATVRVTDVSEGAAELKELYVRVEWTMEYRRRVSREMTTLVARVAP